MDIADWRRKIDEIDRKLVEILNQRAQAAQEIGRLKRDADLPVYEPDRERTVLTKVQEMNQGPLHHRHLLQIYERIMDVMRNIQKDEMVHKDEIVGEPGATQVDTELDADVQD
jgi:chorismate mutase-like protein